jgi:septal ring factor EnvC (AmiA/AmiB activator)
MANRDLFRGIDAYDSQRRREPLSKSPLQVLGRRLMVQAAAALLLFCGIVYLYEQESAIGEGVRYIVALASADEQEVMAVGSFADLWQDLRGRAEQLQADVSSDTDKKDESDDMVLPTLSTLDEDPTNYQPGEEYLAAAQLDESGNLVMILPASGLMQSAFGDIDEQGLTVSGLKIFCQNQQEVKAAAIGEVVEVVAGEKIVLQHRDGVESCYQGAIEPVVQVGETLRQGQLLGHITESTLFFQVVREETPLDPFLFVKGPE